MPSGSPITKSGCGVSPPYSSTTATGSPRSKATPHLVLRELALIEVAQRVRRAQPVALEELAQQLPIARGGDSSAALPSRRSSAASRWPSVRRPAQAARRAAHHAGASREPSTSARRARCRKAGRAGRGRPCRCSAAERSPSAAPSRRQPSRSNAGAGARTRTGTPAERPAARCRGRRAACRMSPLAHMVSPRSSTASTMAGWRSSQPTAASGMTVCGTSSWVSCRARDARALVGRARLPAARRAPGRPACRSSCRAAVPMPTRPQLKGPHVAVHRAAAATVEAVVARPPAQPRRARRRRCATDLPHARRPPRRQISSASAASRRGSRPIGRLELAS